MQSYHQKLKDVKNLLASKMQQIPRCSCQLAKHVRVSKPGFCQYRASAQSIGTWWGSRGPAALWLTGESESGSHRSPGGWARRGPGAGAGTHFPSTSHKFLCEAKGCLNDGKHSALPESVVRVPGRVVVLFSSRKQEGECYLVKPEIPRLPAYVSPI